MVQGDQNKELSRARPPTRSIALHSGHKKPGRPGKPPRWKIVVAALSAAAEQQGKSTQRDERGGSGLRNCADCAGIEMHRVQSGPAPTTGVGGVEVQLIADVGIDAPGDQITVGVRQGLYSTTVCAIEAHKVIVQGAQIEETETFLTIAVCSAAIVAHNLGLVQRVGSTTLVSLATFPNNVDHTVARMHVGAIEVDGWGRENEDRVDSIVSASAIRLSRLNSVTFKSVESSRHGPANKIICSKIPSWSSGGVCRGSSESERSGSSD